MSNRGTTNDDVELGSRIRLARKRMNMSQTEVAKALGVTYQQVQKYENGSDRIAVSRLMVIARTLKVPVAALIPGGDGEEVALLTTEEIAALAAFRQIGSPAMRRAAVDALKAFAAVAPSDMQIEGSKRRARS